MLTAPTVSSTELLVNKLYLKGKLAVGDAKYFLSKLLRIIDNTSDELYDIIEELNKIKGGK